MVVKVGSVIAPSTTLDAAPATVICLTAVVTAPVVKLLAAFRVNVEVAEPSAAKVPIVFAAPVELIVNLSH